MVDRGRVINDSDCDRVVFLAVLSQDDPREGDTLSRRPPALSRFAHGGAHLFGYWAGTVLLAITALASIPALITADGLASWSGFAIGQAAGGVAAAAVNLGLSVSGPGEIASTSDSARRGLLLRSITVRAVILIPATVIAAGIAGAVAPTVAVIAWVGVLQQSVNGMSDRWYLVGMARPAAVFLWDAIPRTLANVAAVAAVYLAGAGLLEAAAILVLGTGVAWLATTIASLRMTRGVQAQTVTVRAFLKRQTSGLWVNVSESTLVAAPVLLIGAFVPSALADYAFYDKVYRQGTSAMAPVAQVLQPWSARRTGRAQWRRIEAAIGVGGTVALLTTIIGALLGAPVLTLLAAGEVRPGLLEAVLISAAIGLWVLRMISVRSGLIPLGDGRFVRYSSMTGMIVSLLLIVGGAHVFGADGALAGIAVGVFLQCVAYLWRLLVLRSRSRRMGWRTSHRSGDSE